MINACRSVCGPIFLASPARLATQRTIRPGSVTVQPVSGSGGEDGSFAAPSDGQVDRPGGPGCERDHHVLAALAGDRKRPVPSLGPEGLDVSAGGIGHPQPVQGEQRDRRVLGRGTEPGSDEQSADLVAVQTGGVRFESIRGRLT